MELIKKWIIPILLIISIGINIYLLFIESRGDKNQYDTQIIQRLDSINNRIDSIKVLNTYLTDSIVNYETKVYNINKEYEKDYKTILTQPVDSDCIFFSSYLSENFK